jgi:dCTP deaminase
MLLSDYDIEHEMMCNRIIIDPYDPRYLQPASYDVHLDTDLLVPVSQPLPNEGKTSCVPKGGYGYYDPGADKQPLMPIHLGTRDDSRYYLPPEGVALGNTIESLTLHRDAPIAADITGCSSLGRWFLAVHVTAGFIDPNWSGQLTLEIVNLSPWWLRLWAGMRIGQIRFYRMSNPSHKKYGDVGHYYGSVGPVGSKYTP